MSLKTSGDRSSQEDMLSLWHEYRDSGDSRLRDRLVMSYAPLVKYLAFKKVRDLPAHLDVEDMISSGLEALTVAIDRYDPGKGAPLRQYLWTRIDGAMIDELRRHDWAPRPLRRRQREIERASARFATTHGREPSARELAGSIGSDIAELREVQTRIRQADIGSLHTEIVDEAGESTELIDLVASHDSSADPVAVLDARDERQRLRSALSSLPGRYQTLAVLLYVHELTLREAGEVFGVSESRVCQMHAELRARLSEAPELADGPVAA